MRTLVNSIDFSRDIERKRNHAGRNDRRLKSRKAHFYNSGGYKHVNLVYGVVEPIHALKTADQRKRCDKLVDVAVRHI